MKETEKLKVAGPIKLPVMLDGEKPSLFKLYLFRLADGDYYVVESGKVRGVENPPTVLVRVHSACNIAHIFHSERCDCEAQLKLAMRRIDKARRGLLIYIMSHEGRGVGTFDHVRVYMKQDEGLDTVDSYVTLGLPVDARNYKGVESILKWFGVRSVALLTNNPRKVGALRKFGFSVTRQPLIPALTLYNQSQIKAKVQKLGHLIPRT